MSNATSALPPLVTGSLDAIAIRLAAVKQYAVGAILVWFAVLVSPYWNQTPDSAIYLLLGRSLAQGHGYTLDGHPHTYVPPGFPLLLAALERAGLGSMFCLNLAMAVMGALSVWMSYRLVSEMASRPVAALVACLLGFNALVHTMSTLQLSDTPFTLLVLAGFYWMLRGVRGERWALEWGTLAMLASCWVRVAGVALALACAVGLLIQPRSAARLRVAANVVALFVGVAVTLGIYYAQYRVSLRAEHAKPPYSYMAGVQALITQPIGSLILRTLSNSYESAAETMRFSLGMHANPIAALVVCLVPALVGVGRRLARREFLIPLAVAGYAGGIVLNLPAGARYLLPVAPILILYYLEGTSILLDWRPGVRRWAPQVLFVLITGFVALNVAKSSYSMYRSSHQLADERAKMEQAADCLRTQARPGDHFLACDNEWPLAYLSGLSNLQVDRWLLAKTMGRDEYLRYMFDQSIRLVVAVPLGHGKYPDEALFREAVRDRRMFEPIANNGRYQVYRYLSPPAVDTASSTARMSKLGLQ
jgi:Dolichyl-phosphate-mannose-protein mannosyltransferase